MKKITIILIFMLSACNADGTASDTHKCIDGFYWSADGQPIVNDEGAMIACQQRQVLRVETVEHLQE